MENCYGVMGLTEVSPVWGRCFPCLCKVESGRCLGPCVIAGRDFSLFKPACPKMAALTIWNLFAWWFPQDLDLFERSLATLGLKQRLYILKTLTRPTRLFACPSLSCSLVVVCLCFLHFSSLEVDSAGKEFARKTHLLFSLFASEVSCSDYLFIVRLLGGYFSFLFSFDGNQPLFL